MKIPEEIRWGFDVEASAIPVLKIPKGRLLWGILRSNHIVDQYFSDGCLEFINDFIDRPCTTYAEFYNRVRNCRTFNGMGRVFDGDSGYSAVFSHLDEEYWQEVYNALNGKLQVKMMYEVTK